MNKLFLLKLYLKNIIIYFVITIIALFSFKLVLNNINIGNPEYNPKLAYYNGADTEKLEKLLKANNIDYGYTMPTHQNDGEKFDSEQYEIISELDQKVNLNNVKYLKETSKNLATRNNSAILMGNVNQKFSLNYMLYPKFIGNTKMVYQNGPGTLIAGNLPQDEKEIIIPENYALELINKSKTIKSYDELINTEIKISKGNFEKSYKVSGITSVNSFYTKPNKQEETEFIMNNPKSNDAIFINFASISDRNKFINKYDFKFEITSLLQLNNLVVIIEYGSILISQLLLNILICTYVNKIAKKLNHNYKVLSNYLLPWVLPAIIINTIYIYLYIFMY